MNSVTQIHLPENYRLYRSFVVRFSKDRSLPTLTVVVPQRLTVVITVQLCGG